MRAKVASLLFSLQASLARKLGMTRSGRSNARTAQRDEQPAHYLFSYWCRTVTPAHRAHSHFALCTSRRYKALRQSTHFIVSDTSHSETAKITRDGVKASMAPNAIACRVVCLPQRMDGHAALPPCKPHAGLEQPSQGRAGVWGTPRSRSRWTATGT